MVCSHIEEISDVLLYGRGQTWLIVVTSATFLVASIPLLLYGARVARLYIPLIASVGSGALLLAVTESLGNCTVRLVLAGSAAALALLLVLCLYRTGIFVLGAAASVASVQLIYASFDIPETGAQVWGVSIERIAISSGVAVAAGVATVCKPKPALVVSTAALGGVALSGGIYIATYAHVRGLALIAIGSVCAFASMLFQTSWHRRICRKGSTQRIPAA